MFKIIGLAKWRVLEILGLEIIGTVFYCNNKNEWKINSRATNPCPGVQIIFSSKDSKNKVNEPYKLTIHGALLIISPPKNEKSMFLIPNS